MLMTQGLTGKKSSVRSLSQSCNSWSVGDRNAFNVCIWKNWTRGCDLANGKYWSSALSWIDSKRQALMYSQDKLNSPPPNHRHSYQEVSTQTNSKDTERSNGCRPLWLPPVDLADTITMLSYENYEAAEGIVRIVLT